MFRLESQITPSLTKQILGRPLCTAGGQWWHNDMGHQGACLIFGYLYKTSCCQALAELTTRQSCPQPTIQVEVWRKPAWTTINPLQPGCQSVLSLGVLVRPAARQYWAGRSVQLQASGVIAADRATAHGQYWNKFGAFPY
jgi:hypothetical protein